MVSVERLFHVQVLLDVIVHVPPPQLTLLIFTIQSMSYKNKPLSLEINSLGLARENIAPFYSLGIVNYAQRSVNQGWN